MNKLSLLAFLVVTGVAGACSTPTSMADIQSKLCVNACDASSNQICDLDKLKDILAGLCNKNANLQDVNLSETECNLPETECNTSKTGCNTPKTGCNTAETNCTVPKTECIVPEKECTVPETETKAPETQTKAPETQTNAPETQTKAPETETKAPETQTKAPETQTKAPETETTKQDTKELSYAEQVVQLVNAERKKAGLNPLTLDSKLASAALIRAKETERSFSHTRPDGRSFSTVLTDNGITFRGAGENIAWGQRSPEEVMNGWMNSSGHRANILNPNYTKIGVGYYQNSSGRNFWSQLFTY